MSLFDLPFRLFSFLGLALFLISFFALLVFVVLRIRDSRKGLPERVGKVGWAFHGCFTGVVLCLLLAFSFALILFSSYIGSRDVPENKKLVALVRCLDIEGQGGYDMRLEYTPVGGETQTYLLRGDQWSIEGHIIKWDGRLLSLGIAPGYKITRVRGRYLDLDGETKYPPTVYDIGDDVWEKMWELLYKGNDYLPMVDAVYGSSCYSMPDSAHPFEMYITSAGFEIIKVK